MKIDRRRFLGASVAGAALSIIESRAEPIDIRLLNPGSFDPWIEVISESIAYNVQQLYELSGKKQVIAVAKNNAYGLGLGITGPLLDRIPEVRMLAVVKSQECFELRKAGVTKPILLLALPQESDEEELIRLGVQFSVFSEGMLTRLSAISTRLQRAIEVHAYIDTGMSRVGVAYPKASQWMADRMAARSFRFASTFTDLTEDPEFDKEQVRRLKELVTQCKLKSIDTGWVHAASSHAVYHYPGACIDLIRPGLSLYGGYPDRFEEEASLKPLKPAVRLRARVVRVHQLQTGDSVSYARKFVASEPTWIATLPVGHSDGYPRTAVKGAKVLIGGKLYPVIGAVSASHTIVRLGAQPEVKVGDVATLMGPDHPEIHPNHIANATGESVYDLFMHLHAGIPRITVAG